MKLTNGNNWNTYAGGTCAASDKHSYDVQTSIGDYKIAPVSSKHDAEMHLGYRVHFCNVLGKLPGGLWQPLEQGLTNLARARRLCQSHMEEHNGEYVSGG